MGDFEQHIDDEFSQPQYTGPYGELRYYQAVLSDGQELYDDQDDEDNDNDVLLVQGIQPEERINVTLYYAEKTLCTYWSVSIIALYLITGTQISCHLYMGENKTFSFRSTLKLIYRNRSRLNSFNMDSNSGTYLYNVQCKHVMTTIAQRGRWMFSIR